MNRESNEISGYYKFSRNDIIQHVMKSKQKNHEFIGALIIRIY